jgi:hypothetical protein
MDKIVNASQIDWKTWRNILDFKAEYNKKRDIFFAYSTEERDAVSIDCNGEFWVRIDPENGEILGIEIEDFKKVFLKKHPEIIQGKTSYIRPIADLIQTERCLTYSG